LPPGLSSSGLWFRVLGVPFPFTSTSFRHRSSVPSGISYQIGNAISSPAAEIVTAISEHTIVTYKGRKIEAFGPTMGVATAIIAVSLAFWTSVGREQGKSF